MSKNNTTAKGNAFEERVFVAIEDELKNERLIVLPKQAKLHHKKSYYSKDRNADIITDVSIEVFLPDKDEPTLIWVFECKDYSGSIPVNDIEEFHSKLQQIGEDNTKGTIVISGALQAGALNYAKAKRIGVIRLLPSNQIQHMMGFITMESIARSQIIDWSEFPAALTTPNHTSKRYFFAASDDCCFGNWQSLFHHVLSKTT